MKLDVATLLGPVAVGIVLIENTEYEKIKTENIFQAGKDSKKLTPKKREEYFAKIKELKYGKQRN